MKNTKKETSISVISIVFYVVAVIFLCIAAFNIWQAYQTVQNYQATYTLTIADIFGVYFSSCAQYFAYSFLLYGVGAILGKVALLNNTMSKCMDDAIEVQSEIKEMPIDETLIAEPEVTA